jgi:hypothetical protein
VQGISSVVFFGYEGEKGRIDGLEELPGSSGVLGDFPNIFADDAPTIVEEIESEPIWPRGFSQWGVLKRLIELLLSDWSHECLIFLFGDLLGNLLEDRFDSPRAICWGFH